MCELLLVRNQPGEDALSNRLFVGVNPPLTRRWVMLVKPCLKAFWFAGGPDLPRIPAMSIE